MVHECPECDYKTDSYNGLGVHYGKTHDGNLLASIHGEDKIRELYSEYGSTKIAEKLGVGKNTAVRAIEFACGGLDSPKEAAQKRRERQGITANVWNTRPPYLTHHSQGYEEIRHRQTRTYVHRLSAVAWFGLDAVVDKHVHHKNNIPWDNREENLEVKTESEHRSHHAQEMWDNGHGIGSQND